MIFKFSNFLNDFFIRIFQAPSASGKSFSVHPTPKGSSVSKNQTESLWEKHNKSSGKSSLWGGGRGGQTTTSNGNAPTDLPPELQSKMAPEKEEMPDAAESFSNGKKTNHVSGHILTHNKYRWRDALAIGSNHYLHAFEDLTLLWRIGVNAWAYLFIWPCFLQNPIKEEREHW